MLPTLFKRFSCLLAVFFLSSSVISSAGAENMCLGEIFLKPDPQDSLLARLVQAEDDLHALTEMTQFRTQTDKIKMEILRTLLPRTEKALAEYEEVSDTMSMMSFDRLDKEIAHIQEMVNKIKVDRDMLFLRETNWNFAVLMDSPELVKPNRFYKVKGIDPYVERVMFSEDVVNDVFWSEEPLYQHAASHFLHAIFRGKVGHKEVGITQFTGAADVYKVRILGQGGAMRLAGFFVGRDYYVVSWSNESSHDAHTSQRLINDVRRIRQQMGL